MDPYFLSLKKSGKLNKNRTILFIGIAEILIGGVTLLATFSSLVFSQNEKSLNVLIFVVLAAAASTVLGIGILQLKKLAHQSLIYFSSVIIFSKILIAGGIIQLNGALVTVIPGDVKDSLSLAYHTFIIIYLSRGQIRQLFKH